MKKIEQLPCLFQAEIPSEEFSQSPHISLCFENHLICSRSSQIDVISFFVFRESQNAWGWKGSLKGIGFSQGHLEPVSPRPCLLTWFWTSPRMEASQPPWAAYASAWSPSQSKSISWCSEGISCFSLCPLPPFLSLGTTESSLALSSSYLSIFRYLYTLRRFPRAAFSLAVLILSAFHRNEMLQSINHLSVPLLGFLQQLRNSHVLGRPELDLALQMWPQQCWGKGKDHFPQPVGSTLSNTAEVTISHLCCKGTLLPHVQIDV